MWHAFPHSLAVSLVFLASASSTLAQDNCARPRLISVNGTAEVNVAPDEAILRLGVESRDKELAVAKSRHDERVKKLIGIARDAGVEAKYIQTSQLTMGPEYSDNYRRSFAGFQVSQSISLTLKDLSKYEVLMIRVLEAGVNEVQGIEFAVADPAKYRAEARLKAIRIAREKAGAMATQLGQTVGRPWEISEEGDSPGLFSFGARANANYAYNAGDKFAAGADESTVAPGEVTIRASVRVSFQLE
jgi:uncharacterized protein YggE